MNSVLVDGDNLVHAARALEDAGQSIGRSVICAVLGGWARRTGETVHVVLDGLAPPPGAARQIGGDDIRVSFSGSGISADAVMIQLLEEDSAARRCLVVSSDRAIRRAAKRRRARSVRSDEFWLAAKAELARPIRKRVEPEEKRTGLRPESTTEWLKTFGLD